MVSERQKYFISTGTSKRISSQIRKKWSAELRLGKITALKSARVIFSLRKSFAGAPSTCIKDLKSIFRLSFLASSAYGFLSFSGFGNVTSILLTFFFLSSKILYYCSILQIKCLNQN